MRILAESGMKNGRKFLVFMSDEDEDNSEANLICLTVDFDGRAHVYRTIDRFFKSVKSWVSRDLQDLIPQMEEVNKDRLKIMKEDFRKKNLLGYR